MRPIAVFCFSATERPGYFTQWLDASHLPWRLFRLDASDLVPIDPREFAGIGLMGAQISANDPHRWVPALSLLLYRAINCQVPIIGHCLGSQILAKTLGAGVERADIPEIGWHEVEVCKNAPEEWFGRATRFTPFQWHYDQFALPTGARRVLTSKFNANQAFIFDDRHLGIQCHIEVDRPQIEMWCQSCAHLLPDCSDATRQSSKQILQDIDARIGRLRQVTDAIYTRWSHGLRG